MENRLFEVRCPHCGELLSIEIGEEEAVQTECPYCQMLFVAESGDDPAFSPAVPAVPEKRDEEPHSAAEEDGSPSKIFGLPARVLILSLSAVVFALVILLFAVLQQSNRKNMSLPSDTEISPGTVHLDETADAEENVSAVDESPAAGEDEGDEEAENPGSSYESETAGDLPPIESNYPDFEFPDSSMSSSYDSNENAAPEPGEEELSLPETVNPELSNEEDLQTEEPASLPESTTEIPASKSDSDDADSSQEKSEDNFDVDMYSRGESQMILPPPIESAEPIDIEKRLGMPIRGIRLANAGLSDFIRLFYQLTGVPVELDWVSFASPVPMWEKRIAYSASDLTCEEFLHEFSTSFGLEVLPEDDRIHLALPKTQNEPMTAAFDCADLLGETAKKEKSAPIVDKDTDPIFPEILTETVLEKALCDLVLDRHFSFGENQQDAELTWEGSVLKLTAGRRTVERAKVFFDRLRSLRHLPPKFASEAEILIPENLCWDHKLSESMNLCLLRPTPLSEVLYLLKRERGLDFFFDYSEIPGGGTVLETPVKLIASEQPLEQILTELLTPLRLEWVVLTENLLAVTSPDRGEIFDTEIHFYAEPDEEVPVEKAAELAHEIKENIAPSTWNPEGGGMIWIDPSSRSFLIRQTLRNQRRIRRFVQPGLVGKENS